MIYTLKCIVLGFVQGATEFLPISSSGHLVIFQGLFNMQQSQVFLDVMVHVGTLLAILIVFRKDILEMIKAASRGLTPGTTVLFGQTASQRLLVAIFVGSLPTALIGFLFAEQFEKMFESMTFAGFGLLITGCVLILTECRRQEAPAQPGEPARGISLLQALLIGTAQGVAIMPGISRSGSTIAVALLLGVPRELAARFSFLLAVPAVIGALLFEFQNFPPAGAGGAAGEWPAVFAAAAVAAVVGIASLKLLLRVVKQGKISLFAYYCWLLGFIAIIGGLLKG